MTTTLRPRLVFQSRPTNNTHTHHQVRGSQQQCGTLQLSGADAGLRHEQRRRRRLQCRLQHHRHSKRRHRSRNLGLGAEAQLPLDGSRHQNGQRATSNDRHARSRRRQSGRRRRRRRRHLDGLAARQMAKFRAHRVRCSYRRTAFSYRRTQRSISYDGLASPRLLCPFDAGIGRSGGI